MEWCNDTTFSDNLILKYIIIKPLIFLAGPEDGSTCLFVWLINQRPILGVTGAFINIKVNWAMADHIDIQVHFGSRWIKVLIPGVGTRQKGLLHTFVLKVRKPLTNKPFCSSNVAPAFTLRCRKALAYHKGWICCSVPSMRTVQPAQWGRMVMMCSDALCARKRLLYHALIGLILHHNIIYRVLLWKPLMGLEIFIIIQKKPN